MKDHTASVGGVDRDQIEVGLTYPLWQWFYGRVAYLNRDDDVDWRYDDGDLERQEYEMHAAEAGVGMRTETPIGDSGLLATLDAFLGLIYFDLEHEEVETGFTTDWDGFGYVLRGGAGLAYPLSGDVNAVGGVSYEFMHTDDDPVSAAVFDFVDQWHRDMERGEHFDLAHYQTRFPGHDDAIRAEFESLTSVPIASALPVGMRWNGKSEQELKASLRLFSEDGTLVAQEDRPIRPEMAVTLFVPPDAIPGPYILQLLVYDEETFDPVHTEDGQSIVTMTAVELRQRE